MSPSKNPADEPFGSIMAFAEEMQQLARVAVVQYTPVVEGINSSKSRDVHHIEHTLDHLLDFGFYAPIVELFRKLCRHYYFIDPGAAADYVFTYRDMWDSEESGEES
ncbi:MAG: hypothetical protein HGA97_06830 [Chlorobiaceae bacterium]|jgi:hypothetical protein|nr:hypothetical protein [Chlorobiaceae bacterium]